MFVVSWEDRLVGPFFRRMESEEGIIELQNLSIIGLGLEILYVALNCITAAPRTVPWQRCIYNPTNQTLY